MVVLVDEASLSGIASAIRSKNGTNNVYKPGQMAAAIQALPGAPTLQSKTANANGTVTPDTGYDGLSQVTVNVPNSYSQSDEGKVVSNGALVAQTARSGAITQNGTYDTTNNNEVTVNVSGGGGGGGTIKGFEVYAADQIGGSRYNSGILDNQYFSCFFDDNMNSTYTLNGLSATFSVQAPGRTGQNGLKATTKAVANPAASAENALIVRSGSVFTASHWDGGAYVAVVGGWAGYPVGGNIYEQAANGTTNSITMPATHSALLIFVGASIPGSAITSIDINGKSYSVTNLGAKYDNEYGSYTAVEIIDNTDTIITVTFPTSCWNYVSIIGID